MKLENFDKFVADLTEIVGSTGIVLGDDLRSRAASSTDPEPHSGMMLVRPANTQELSKVVTLCHELKQAIVVQGGLTGVVSGATANKNELAVSLERMTQIESIDVNGKTMTVQSGTTLQTVQEYAAEHDLLFAVDWGARGSATMGGGISTNAGGNSVLRYGMMRDHVLGLEVVLADGSIMSSMNKMLKNNTGYDLKQLFIGSEGTLGIITKAVVRLQTATKSQQTALVALENFDDVIALLSLLDGRLGGTLSAYEVMWKEHYKMIVEDGGHSWILPPDHGFYVVVEANGVNEELDSDRFEGALGEAFENELLVDAIICNSVSQRESVWAIRDDIDTLFRSLEPMIGFDISVPISDMPAYLQKVTNDMEDAFPGCKGTTFGHLGDSNLHVCWCVGSDGKEERSEVSRIVYDNLMPYDGSVSAEHGIGIDKRAYLNRSRNEQEIKWMRNLKHLFDPQNILNPGRVLIDSAIENEKAKL